MPASHFEPVFSISDLENLGFRRRVVYHYVEIGVLPRAVGHGRGAHYTSEHVRILQFVLEQRERNRTLDDLRGMIEDGAHRPKVQRKGKTHDAII